MAVKNYVWAHPGVDAKTLIKGIKHHYRTPITAVVQIVSLSEQGVISGVRVERTGRQIRFYPEVAGLSERQTSTTPGAPVSPVKPSPTLGATRTPERRQKPSAASSATLGASRSGTAPVTTTKAAPTPVRSSTGTGTGTARRARA